MRELRSPGGSWQEATFTKADADTNWIFSPFTTSALWASAFGPHFPAGSRPSTNLVGCGTCGLDGGCDSIENPHAEGKIFKQTEEINVTIGQSNANMEQFNSISGTSSSPRTSGESLRSMNGRSLQDHVKLVLERDRNLNAKAAVESWKPCFESVAGVFAGQLYCKRLCPRPCYRHSLALICVLNVVAYFA